ncbi:MULTISPECIES: adenosylmethionine--8-amino-7-oxononanoate transaminase [Methylobacterium]|uniref:Adenosylmethionine-8-amino-7-oxononanoate aminotransferase n=3 Tax=Pseudomonadota TaxID=1224 RepID=A0ABQ4STL2_9HYPH|nr:MULTISPECIES: adenosylmethionine--8-amino-7-oxononanoate transaminase [Methylobacterium]PIU06194.1 MAG: adenosylmethionine--8-amino-7-oxononanoate transaminase [Methylobacterium sp. CG09_land_8_20_14_0_10_71_15]PIU14485.1 MAG: adenosylmethionine--8-amino-7-oxononanoate transaminase [Methylobacterium sp. CG08_land_8_20_14_0_20_71_15]GBU18247.1 7,8-diaminopelargonic acid synthase [Methylobacterium sp.]GJE05168.1 Adenosylmethionine-8-amino-7-oxononanoate aminotransferase [Methylobacterium jeotg
MTRASHHLWRPYTQMRTADPPLEAVRTHGSRIVLADGRELIDGIASWWTAVHGYNHPHIAEALSGQLATMPHVMFGGLTHAPAERLAARLAALLPGTLDHVFFTDSGSVAVEVALKMAVQLWLNRGVTGRTRVLAFRGGYHGDTMGAMSACDPEEGMHRRFGAYLPAQVFCDLPRRAAETDALDATLARHREELAAVIVEPLVQGAGGMLMHEPETLATVARLARRHGLPLILDEIFTGFGRTGTLFACEQAGIVPDILCLSKALTGGTLALAATVASREVFEAFLSDDPAAALMHGPTFMANPLACAAANASLDLFETEPRLAQARAIEARLREGLASLAGRPGIAGVRCLGAIGAVEFEAPPDLAGLKRRLVERGVWVRPFGRILYLTPALSVPEADLARLIEETVRAAAEAMNRA